MFVRFIFGTITILMALINGFNIFSSIKFEPLGISAEALEKLQWPFLLATLGIFTLSLKPVIEELSKIRKETNKLVNQSKLQGIERFRERRRGNSRH